MSDISVVRSIIQDKPVHQEEVVSFDGVIVTYRVKVFPIDPTSVVTTPVTTPTTVNAETGLLTWNAAPALADVNVEYDCLLLSDQTITDLITINTEPDGSYELRLVAADALDSMASNQAIIQKVIKNLDLETNGAALAKVLRDHAKNLRDQVFDPKYQIPSFDFAQQINDKPGWKEKVIKDILRQNG